MSDSNSGALRALSQELKGLNDEPVEGFRVQLSEDGANWFEWDVAIFGPPGTIYEGGYFKAKMQFPRDYPFNPPSIRFDKATPLYHPNVYDNGDLCISILHPPTNDPQSGELPCERWNPTQNVRTILLSVVSLLNEPNTSSPANVDASVMYRRWKETNGKENQYEKIVKKQVNDSKAEAIKDGVVVPTTLEEYVVKPLVKTQTKSSMEMNLYDDDDDFDLDDDQNSFDGSFDGSDPGSGGNSPSASPEPHGHNKVDKSLDENRTNNDEWGEVGEGDRNVQFSYSFSFTFRSEKKDNNNNV